MLVWNWRENQPTWVLLLPSAAPKVLRGFWSKNLGSRKVLIIAPISCCLSTTRPLAPPAMLHFVLRSAGVRLCFGLLFLIEVKVILACVVNWWPLWITYCISSRSCNYIDLKIYAGTVRLFRWRQISDAECSKFLHGSHRARGKTAVNIDELQHNRLIGKSCQRELRSWGIPR